MLMWAVLLIYAAIYMGALDQLESAASGWRRMWKATGLIALTYGVLLMVGAAGGGDDLFRPLQGTTFLSAGGKVAEPTPFKQVKGFDGLQGELLQARSRGQTTMLDFYADWCVSCKELEKYTFSDPGVRVALAGTLLLQTDVTLNDEVDKELLQALGIFGPPAILFFGSDGRERREYRLVGFVEADEFRDHVRSAFSDRSI
jgi:thiol:disulfide interchange protein DsbD